MAEPVLVSNSLSKRFGALTACEAVSIELKAGEIHALIGPNGAGKSTLIKLITGELAPDKGQVLFDGKHIDALTQPERARLGLARTFQVSSIVPEFSVLQNVMLSAQGAANRSFGFFVPAVFDRALTRQAQEPLQRLNLQARAGDPAAALSHGERRRLEIAMALAMKPRAFLMDEPMAGMGPEGSAELTQILSELRRDAPILLVEHDMDAVFALADRVSVLVSGQVIATGSVDDIRRSRTVQEAYLGDMAP